MFELADVEVVLFSYELRILFFMRTLFCMHQADCCPLSIADNEQRTLVVQRRVHQHTWSIP